MLNDKLNIKLMFIFVDKIDLMDYCNDPKFSDRYARAKSADPDQTEEQSDQSLQCLPFRLHRLDSLLYGRVT